MVKRLPAGEMRHRVNVKQHKQDAGTTAYDSYGQLSASSTAWATLVSRRAKIEQLGGSEAELARQIYPKATYKVTLDYNETLATTGGSRRAVEFNSRMLHIGAVINPDMENVRLELLCGEER
jgi:head-tail adaptor